MRRTVRRLARGVAALLTLLGVVAAPAAPGAEPSTLTRVLSEGALRVCTTGDYRPFSFLRADGAYEGMDIDLAERLAASLNAHVVFVRTSWPTLMADFTAGKCDLAAGGVSVSLERARRAGFSRAYLVDGKAPIARCGDARRFTTLAAIDQPGVRVIVNPGGTNERFARAHLTHAELSVFPDNVTIFDEIVAGRADVMITDRSETLMQQKLHPELCAITPAVTFQYGEKALMLPQGDAAWHDYVDQWLHLMDASGELATLEGRWLQ